MLVYNKHECFITGNQNGNFASSITIHLLCFISSVCYEKPHLIFEKTKQEASAYQVHHVNIFFSSSIVM